MTRRAHRRRVLRRVSRLTGQRPDVDDGQWSAEWHLPDGCSALPPQHAPCNMTHVAQCSE